MLDDEQVERYARQIVVPGIGAAGQEKLLESTVLVVGHPRGCATAELYLRAAGVRVSSGRAADADLIVVCDLSSLESGRMEEIRRSGRPVIWYQLCGNGFASGVYPEHAIPEPEVIGGASSLHDVASCDAAAAACGLLSGSLPAGSTARFEV